MIRLESKHMKVRKTRKSSSPPLISNKSVKPKSNKLIICLIVGPSESIPHVKILHITKIKNIIKGMNTILINLVTTTFIIMIHHNIKITKYKPVNSRVFRVKILYEITSFFILLIRIAIYTTCILDK